MEPTKISTPAPAAQPTEDLQEFACAVAFLRELQAHTTVTPSPGPLYTAGYHAGIAGAIVCLEKPERARAWLAARKAEASHERTD